MNEITLRSVDTAATLTFSNIEGDYFTASYESPELRVSRRVWGYTDCEFLIDLFEGMAREWKGWEGEKTWVSIEGEFGLSCSSDRLGHVRIKLSFVQFEGKEPWRVEPTLNLEAGQMGDVAKYVRKFFVAEHIYTDVDRKAHLEELARALAELIPLARELNLKQVASYEQALVRTNELRSSSFTQEDLSELSRLVPDVISRHRDWESSMLVEQADGSYDFPAWFKELEDKLEPALTLQENYESLAATRSDESGLHR